MYTYILHIYVINKLFQILSQLYLFSSCHGNYIEKFSQEDDLFVGISEFHLYL